MPEPDVLALCEQLDGLRAAATPGPWTSEGNFTDGWALARARIEDPDGMPVHTPSGWTCYDAALIVAAVNAIEPLTAAVRGLLADRDTLTRVAEIVTMWDERRPIPGGYVAAIRRALDGAS